MKVEDIGLKMVEMARAPCDLPSLERPEQLLLSWDGIGPTSFGRQLLHLCWAGFYEEAISRARDATDEQLMTTASIEAVRYAVRAIEDREAAFCEKRYIRGLLPGPVLPSLKSHFLLSPVGEKSEIAYSPPAYFEGDDSSQFVRVVEVPGSFSAERTVESILEKLRDPSDFDAKELAAIWCAMEDEDLCALELFSLCLEHKPLSSPYQMSVTSMLRRLGRDAEALEAVTGWVRRSPDRPDLLMHWHLMDSVDLGSGRRFIRLLRTPGPTMRFVRAALVFIKQAIPIYSRIERLMRAGQFEVK